MRRVLLLAGLIAALLAVPFTLGSSTAKPQCGDGRDNDQDGLIDWPADPGCSGKNDNSESPNPPPPPPPPAPPPPPPPPAPPPAVWTGDMEEGTLADWSLNNGGGEYNSGSGDSTASQTVAHSGSWSAKQTIDTSTGSAGTRLFRWAEFRQTQPGQSLTISAWIYLPSRPTVGGWFNLWQHKSDPTGPPGDDSDVFFQLGMRNRSGSGNLYLDISWGCGANDPNNFPRGPFADSPAPPGGLCLDANEEPRFQPLATVDVPIAQWFNVTATIIDSATFGGTFTVTQNGTPLWNLHNVKTGYPSTLWPSGVDDSWAVNAYANGLSPSLYSHYIDDATIQRGP